jgi:outer membrane protein
MAMDARKVFFRAWLMFPAVCGADALGVRIGANYWHYDIDGTVRFKTRDSSNNIDVNSDLGYDNDNLTFLYAILEHPLPFLPNLKLSRTDIDTSANGRLSKTVVFGDTTFPANEDVSSKLDLKMTDITLYYRVLDNIANIDLGLNAMYLDSDGRITGAVSGTQRADISGWVPKAYVGVGVDLPLTGLSLGADGSAVKYKSSHFYDYTLRVSYTTPWYVGIDAGYRKIKLDLDDFDDSFSDLSFDGFYAGGYLHF